MYRIWPKHDRLRPCTGKIRSCTITCIYGEIRSYTTPHTESVTVDLDSLRFRIFLQVQLQPLQLTSINNYFHNNNNNFKLKSFNSNSFTMQTLMISLILSWTACCNKFHNIKTCVRERVCEKECVCVSEQWQHIY